MFRSNHRSHVPRCRNKRRPHWPRGTTAVEVAFVLPVFLLLVFAMIEFGHVYMTTQLIVAAARAAARTGVADGKTTADVTAKVDEILSAGIDSSQATVYIKDGSAFDDATITTDQINATDYNLLPDIEIFGMDARQLFIVRIEVPYDQVTLIPGGGWLKGLTLSGQAVMRHE